MFYAPNLGMVWHLYAYFGMWCYIWKEGNIVEQAKYWAVVSKFGDKDVTDEFLDEGYWYDGYSDNGDDRYTNVLNK
jgi:hypothetical protein